uniref:Uncharacterized protein n=1 Tax=Vibrio phage P018-4 TaxID=3229728 RepID=A0AB39AJE3_9CAUD
MGELSREERIRLAGERMMNRWPDRDEIEARHMERFKGLTPEQLRENFEKASLERDRKVKEEQEKRESMETITLLDIIKRCRTMNTIRTQELQSTTDFDTLQVLYSAYIDVVMENLVEEYTGCEMKYKEFYDKVLNKFEEMS